MCWVISCGWVVLGLGLREWLRAQSACSAARHSDPSLKRTHARLDVLSGWCMARFGEGIVSDHRYQVLHCVEEALVLTRVSLDRKTSVDAVPCLFVNGARARQKVIALAKRGMPIENLNVHCSGPFGLIA